MGNDDNKGIVSNMDASKLDAKKRPSSNDKLGRFAERLEMIVGDKSARSFAISSGLSPAAFHKYLKAQSEPTRPALSAIADNANVNFKWLIDGTGPMHPADPPQTSFIITNLEGRQVDFTPSPNLCHMPIMDVHASCGPGNAIPMDSVKAVFSATREWVRKELNSNPEDLSFVTADGDSMTETIQPEQIVIVNRSRPQNDGIWTFANEESIYIKRLQFFPGNKVKVSSDNPHYETYTLIPDDTFRLLGRVIAVLPFKKL